MVSGMFSGCGVNTEPPPVIKENAGIVPFTKTEIVLYPPKLKELAGHFFELKKRERNRKNETSPRLDRNVPLPQTQRAVSEESYRKRDQA
jgi:hypothetical protein